MKKDSESYRARAIVTEGEDRDSLLKNVCEAQPPFAEYQARTDRLILVIELRRT
ncbi:MAG: hypothetical protein ACI9BW_002919 [Gammaproteobacteria bacterium]